MVSLNYSTISLKPIDAHPLVDKTRSLKDFSHCQVDLLSLMISRGL